MAARVIKCALALVVAVGVPAVVGQQDYAEQMESLAQRHAGDMRASARADPEGQRREAMAQQMLSDMLRDVSAMLDHGSPTAKEAAVARLLQMAVQSSSGSMFHPTTFRNAAIRSGVVPKIIKLMAAGNDHAKYLGAGALQALALDDPTTTLDNGHQAAICQMGAVPVLVAMLKQGSGGGRAAARSEGVYEFLQTSAASALGTLAEAEACRRLIVAAGAVEPLVAIAMFGSDQTKLAAIGALDMLQFNAADVKAQVSSAGANSLLKGLTQYGSDVLRESAADVLAGLNAPAKALSAEQRGEAVKELRLRNMDRREQLMEQARILYGGVQTPFKVTNPNARTESVEYMLN
ncbi:hypothetical protein KFE25_008506 [Diacronema lutheri]|uniref:Uncharacterized protein n=2 Tax=Diacronema lutheri TaxID=2081491 RepID=A0A8J5XY77_DIALT|nr:hypothetical protein KFE25_008506 [Diacronema lutheri]